MHRPARSIVAMMPGATRQPTIILLALALALAFPAHAAPRWLVRASAAAVCAAQAADLATTAVGANRLHEGNPLYGRADGSVRWSVLAPVKIGICAADVWLTWREGRRPWIPFVNAGVAGATGWAAGKNVRLESR